MGVNRTDYILIGAKLSPLLLDEEKANIYPELFGTPDVEQAGFIYDGMNGEYFLAAVPLNIDDGEDGLPLFEFPIGEPKDKYPELVKQLQDKVWEMFDIHIQPRYMVLSHFH